ncbi:MAG: helix-turn-helix transcriptional regulator [Nitrospiraceae bacterium]
MKEQLLTCPQLAALLSVKPATIRKWTYQRRIPCVRLAGGRAVRYRLSDCEKLIRSGLRPALRPYPSADDGEGGGA